MKAKRYASLLLVLIVILSVCTLVACQQKEETDNTLTIWASGQWTGTDLQNLKAYVEEYNNSNTLGVTLEVVAKSDIESALSTAVRNNKIPDMLIWDRFNTPTYAETGALLDVSEYIARDGIDTTLFNEEAMSEMYYGGSYYGLPLDLDVWGLYINMDMVDAYNEANPMDQIVISDDWTWDDLYDIATKLTQYNDNDEMTVAGYSGHVMHQHYYKYLVSASGEFLDADGNPNFDTQITRDILSFFGKIGSTSSGIWQNGLCEKSNFTSGTLAIIDQSLYFTDYIERYNSDMNYRFMPQPRYSVDGVVQEGAVNGGMLGGFGIAFPKPAEKYLTDEFYEKFELAWKVAKDWLLNEEMQQKWSEQIGTLPILNSLYQSSTFSTETLNRAASFVNNYKIRPQIPGYLTMQTQVIDVHIEAYTQGAVELEQTIINLNQGCKEYIKN